MTLPTFNIEALKAFDEAPRIRDLELAERLGYLSPYDIRLLIARHLEELESHGGIPCIAENITPKGGRPSKAYWLNEAQALIICTLSKTKQAARIRKALIDVFQAYRDGKTVHVREHHRKPPMVNPHSRSDNWSDDDKRAFITAFMRQPDGAASLFEAVFIQLAELRKEVYAS